VRRNVNADAAEVVVVVVVVERATVGSGGTGNSRFAEGALLTSPHPYVGADQMR
jgi:hypothetical protein